MPSYFVQTDSDHKVILIDYQSTNEALIDQLNKVINTVSNALSRQNIEVKTYIRRIIKVYTSPEPEGFDFECSTPAAFLDQVTSQPTIFHFDDPQTIAGFAMAGITRGLGFRQVNPGPALHIEIDAPKNWANVHIDSHGFVYGGNYNCDKMLAHGVWDVASGVSFLSWAYFTKGGLVFNPIWGGLTLNFPIRAFPELGLGKAPELSTISGAFDRYSSQIYAKIGPGAHYSSSHFMADASLTWLRLDYGGASLAPFRLGSIDGSIEFEARASIAGQLGPMNGRLFGMKNLTTGAQDLQGEVRIDFRNFSGSVKRDFLRGNNEASVGLNFGDLQIGGSVKSNDGFGATIGYETTW